MDSWHLDLSWREVSFEEHALFVVVVGFGPVVAEFGAEAVAAVARLVFAEMVLEVVVVAFVAATAESQPCSFELEEASSEENFASFASLVIVVPQVVVVVVELASAAEVIDYS